MKNFNLRHCLFWAMLFAFQWTAFAQNKTLDIALRHLDEQKETLGLTATDLENYRISDQYQTSHNGVEHLYLLQQHEGIDVHNAIININILPNGKVLNMGNRFVADIASKANAPAPALAPKDAIATVINFFNTGTVAPIELLRQDSQYKLIFDKTGLALEDITAELVYELTKTGDVRLAWKVSLYELSAQDWWVARVDASTGEVLDYHNLVIHCSFGDSPSCDHPHHTHVLGKDDAKHAVEVAPIPAVLSDDAVYNVFAMPIESPNHGTRTLTVNPSNDMASPIGWHNDGTQTYTITRGNNVHTYQDIFDQNESLGDEPNGGVDLTFDYPLNIAENRPYKYVDAATTNLFYWNNMIHDVWYHYGFDEVSGNFQESNFGIGGEGEDYLRAEVLDGSGTNNANMATPADGGRPRMQMYFWGSGQPPSVLDNSSVDVLAPASVEGSYVFEAAGFGGEIPEAIDAIISQVVLVDDNMGANPNDGCDEILNAAEIAGKIAMVDRGNCQFGFKALAAENAGAIAVIVCNNSNEDILAMGAGMVGNGVTIPALMMSLADCNTIKMGLPELEVNISLPEFIIPLPGPVGRDGDFDNGVVVHEYTHGISNRLTGGPNQAGCLSNDEQAGEGWSDWYAIAMTALASHNGETKRGMGTFANGEPTSGDGIRTYAYSRNMNINEHTYADIDGESIPHGVGSVWAAMIWDMYWNLVDVYGFDEDFFTGTGGNNIAMQLVTDGMKLNACNPNFIDNRDAIIAADIANNNGVNVCLIWETFARRGLGYSALAGGIEAFDMPPVCINQIVVKKEAPEFVYAGEEIEYVVTVNNYLEDDITNVMIIDNLPESVSLIAGSVSCEDNTLTGSTLNIDLDALTSGQTTICSYTVETAASNFSTTVLEDDLESGGGNWAADGWTPGIGNGHSGSFYWRATPTAAIGEKVLTLNPVTVNGANPFITFWHSYNLQDEKDGGVVEISSDAGATWVDITGFVQVNNYNGIIDSGTSAINGQSAFTGNSGGYIQTTIDANVFSGETIQIRARLVSDNALTGDNAHWFIDDLFIYDNYVAIVNTACVESSSDEVACGSVATVVLQNPLSINDFEKLQGINIYPNPATDQITIANKTIINEAVTIRVFNIDGKEMIRQSFSQLSGNQTMNIAQLNPGVYIVEVQTEKGIHTGKLIKE